MPVWEVLGRRTEGDPFAVVGGVKAPDAEMALLLARETHFRHKEGVSYGVRLRGEAAVHEGAWPARELGGVTDRSYRRQEGYVGVGAQMKRVHRELAERGLVVRGPTPPSARAKAGDADDD